MARTNATELKVRNSLRTVLDTIGDAPTSDWLIHSPGPTVSSTARPPRGPLDSGTENQIFVQYVRTDPDIQTSQAHHKRMVFNVWLVNADPTDVGWDACTKLYADVLRAIRMNEATLEAAGATMGVTDGPFTLMEDAAFSGMTVGLLMVFAEGHSSHNDP